MSASPVSVPDDTEVVPPKSQKQIHRPQRPSMPFPLIDDESSEAQTLVLAHVEVAKGRIRYSDGEFLYNADIKPLG